MKTQKITINKTADQPNGLDIEVVVPENPLEAKLVAFLMTAFLKDLKRENRVNYDLPADFKVEHTRDGTFVVSGVVGQTAFYEPPKPIAIFGIVPVGNRFDLIHAPIPTAQRPAAAPAPETPAAAPEAPAADTQGAATETKE